MRMNNLNNESVYIFKSLGFKPLYHIIVNYGDLDSNLVNEVNIRKYRLISDYRYIVDDDELQNLVPYAYPSLTYSYNLWRLLEYIYKYMPDIYNEITTVYIDTEKEKRFEYQIINNLYYILKNNNYNTYINIDYKNFDYGKEIAYDL